MNDSISPPTDGWNQSHPGNLERFEKTLAELFDGLVLQFGTLTAHQIWKKATARHLRAKAKGRPKGSRSRDHWPDPMDAHRTLHAIATYSGNAGLSRWQVFNRAAAVLDARRQDEQRAKAKASRRPAQTLATNGSEPHQPFPPAPTLEQWVASLPELTEKEAEARQQRINTIQRALERLQDDIDKRRIAALRTYDEMEASVQEDETSSPPAIEQLQQWRSNALAAWPPLPQEGGSVCGRSKWRPFRHHRRT